MLLNPMQALVAALFLVAGAVVYLLAIARVTSVERGNSKQWLS